MLDSFFNFLFQKALHDWVAFDCEPLKTIKNKGEKRSKTVKNEHNSEFDFVLQMFIVFSIRMATENIDGLVPSKAQALGPGVPIEPK